MRRASKVARFAPAMRRTGFFLPGYTLAHPLLSHELTGPFSAARLMVTSSIKKLKTSPGIGAAPSVTTEGILSVFVFLFMALFSEDSLWSAIQQYNARVKEKILTPAQQ
jgi:hypothetical protein